MTPHEEELELPPAPRSLWDFASILSPVVKYYVALLALFFVARWFNRQLDNEADAQERQGQRPVLSPGLTVESSEEEETEAIEELVTDGNRLVRMDGQKGHKVHKKKMKNTAKELFDGLRKVEQELRDKKAKEDAEDNVSWNELHSNMLRRYKEKYPNHGPRVANDETDKYDEEFNELLRKNNIDPNELKSRNMKKTA
ncbi:unnamed protein product [Peronospora belbahrii]|uniref:Cathepsin propeptide inhibitor domain-containing protein n=1 Tax=Peronospora belbahrii TaxID=622444 RepID=A0AAU9KM91_9STRA|nr:unnamed protein product [Peronospora belbahrii]CAH0513271.1 unnamed protein product [Peronospora belbahrii]